MSDVSRSRQRARAIALLAPWVVVASGCPKKSDSGDKPASADAPVALKQVVAASGAERAEPEAQLPIRIGGVGLKTPESVLYDPEQDVYLVSNINGKPLDADGNGFISRISPGGKVLALKWIDGAKEGVALDAPKGMALTTDTLWVADITRVRRFDRKTGEAKGTIEIPKATFVNDLTAAPDGTVYASDSGFGAGFKPSGTDAIWRIGADGEAAVLIKDQALGHPNGVALAGDRLLVVTMGSGELYRISLAADEKEKKKEPIDRKKAPKGSLDGIERMADGSLLVSSWAGKVVYRVSPAGAFAPLAENLDAPADIGVDTKRNRLLVPQFNDDRVVILAIPEMKKDK